MSPLIGIILDVIVIVLLALTITSAWTLSGRLKGLKDSRKELAEMVGKFDQATARADSGIKALQAAAAKSGEDLQDRLNKARNLRDELGMMIETADSLARRLEAAVPARGVEVGPANPTAAPEPRTKAERDLLKAMENRRS